MTQPVCGCRRARRDVPEAPAHVASFGDLDVAAEDDRRHQLLAQRRRRIDLGAQQPDQHGRALRMTDEDHGVAVVVVCEVVLPRGKHAVVGGRDHLGGERLTVPERSLGCLAVHRGPHVAHGRELRGLAHRDVGLFLLDREVRVEARLGRDGRIDVEAVEVLGFGRQGGREGGLGEVHPHAGRRARRGTRVRTQRQDGTARPCATQVWSGRTAAATGATGSSAPASYDERRERHARGDGGSAAALGAAGTPNDLDGRRRQSLPFSQDRDVRREPEPAPDYELRRGEFGRASHWFCVGRPGASR